MKSSRVCWRPGPSGFSRNNYTQTHKRSAGLPPPESECVSVVYSMRGCALEALHTGRFVNELAAWAQAASMLRAGKCLRGTWTLEFSGGIV